jgi:hypothetical protein
VTRQANGNFGSDLNLVPPALQPAYGGSFAQDTVILPNGRSYVVPDYEDIDGIYNPDFGPINVVDNTGHSKYNALQMSLRHQSGEFFARAAYTLAKTTDEGTGYYNQFDQHSQKGLSQLDQRNRLEASAGWTPTHGAMRNFVMSGVLNLASGRPYTGVFDTSEVNFSLVPGEGYNSFTGPGTADVDMSVARSFRFHEHYAVRLRAESFDLLNHANYLSNVNNVQYTTTQQNDSDGNPTNVWTAAANQGFGTPLATYPKYGSRSFQLSGQFSF